jgi:hypothetical protein
MAEAARTIARPTHRGTFAHSGVLVATNPEDFYRELASTLRLATVGDVSLRQSSLYMVFDRERGNGVTHGIWYRYG